MELENIINYKLLFFSMVGVLAYEYFNSDLPKFVLKYK